MKPCFTETVRLNIARTPVSFSIPGYGVMDHRLRTHFKPFLATVPSPEPEALRVCWLSDPAPALAGDEKLLITTDLRSPVYRRGRTFRIERMQDERAHDSGTNRWSTIYDAEREEAVCYIPASPLPPVFPAVSEFPHLQFLLTGHLSRHRGALHHGAGAIYRKRMYMFPALSGTGKSTLSNLLHASGRFEVASDEVIITRFEGNALNAYGSPWPSSAGFARNTGAPLGGIIFLHQSPENRIETVTPADAQRRLLSNTDIPWYDEIFSQGVLDHLHALVQRVPLLAFHFRPDADAVEVLIKSLDQL
jgi:hypothetical protein